MKTQPFLFPNVFVLNWRPSNKHKCYTSSIEDAFHSQIEMINHMPISCFFNSLFFFSRFHKYFSWLHFAILVDRNEFTQSFNNFIKHVLLMSSYCAVMLPFLSVICRHLCQTSFLYQHGLRMMARKFYQITQISVLIANSSRHNDSILQIIFRLNVDFHVNIPNTSLPKLLAFHSFKYIIFARSLEENFIVPLQPNILFSQNFKRIRIGDSFHRIFG